jgi:peptidoglycan/LPS O-acetylase OafA/YrhL
MSDYSAVHPETKAAREPGLDLLRTIAILLVVLSNYGNPASWWSRF